MFIITFSPVIIKKNIYIYIGFSFRPLWHNKKNLKRHNGLYKQTKNKSKRKINKAKIIKKYVVN